MLNSRSIALLFGLFSILMFIVGFKYGKNVEKFNKTYIPPTPLPAATSTPFPTPTLFVQEFSEFSHKDCSISFVLPKSSTKQKISSTEAQLKNQNQEISMSCDKKKVSEIRLALTDIEEKNTEIFGSQKIKIYSSGKSKDKFIILNNFNQKYIYISAPKNLTKLIIKTIEFSK